MFGVSCATENNFFGKWIQFLNFINHFLRLSFSFSNCQTTTGSLLNHHQASTGQLSDHHRAIPEPPQATLDHWATLDHNHQMPRGGSTTLGIFFYYFIIILTWVKFEKFG